MLDIGASNELARHLVLAYNSRNIAALRSLLTGDVVVRMHRRQSDAGSFTQLLGTEFDGPDATLEFFREWMDTLDAHMEIERIRQVDNRALVVVNVSATGAGSGAPAALRSALLLSFRDGRVSAIHTYYEPDEAFKAVELEE